MIPLKEVLLFPTIAGIFVKIFDSIYFCLKLFDIFMLDIFNFHADVNFYYLP